MGTPLEDQLAHTNAGFFLREFSFSRTQFEPKGRTEVELADHIVCFDENLLVFQLKERERPTDAPDQEEKWFASKVAKKAVKQIRMTLECLASNRITLSNDRGHVVELPAGLMTLNVIKVIVYQPAAALPDEDRRRKGHASSSAGFIHFLQASDYEGILNTLVTLPEIVEFFSYRERICTRFPAETNALTERALVGHFLVGDEEAFPTAQHEAYLHCLSNDVEQFQVFPILHKFKDKAYAGYSVQPDGQASQPTDYYGILKEMLRLSRIDLAAFKERFMQAWDLCGHDVVQPSRFASLTTHCGFVFIPLPQEASDVAQRALLNLTMAAKYDLKVDRCVGVAFRKDGEYRLVDWMLESHPWAPDADLERRLAESYPFRKARLVEIPRYRFDK